MWRKWLGTSIIWEAEDKLLECQDIELILCDLFLQDGIAMDFFHSMKKLAGIYQNTKEPIFRELPFFIFTDNKDLSLEYQYRHEGVSDYISSESHLPKSMLFDGRCNRLFFYFQKVYKKVLRYAKIF